MLRKCASLLAGIVLTASIVGGLFAQTKSSVLTTVHNTGAGSNGCGNCHVPHQGDLQKGQMLLWAKTLPATATFGVYSSPTMNSVALEVGGAYTNNTTSLGDKMYTVLCLSCHDGVAATANTVPVSASNRVTNGSSEGLSNDHPVNMPYTASPADPGLKAEGTLVGVKVFTGTVQCASCHDVHNNANLKFLRVSNASSGLCTSCHL